MHVKCVVNVQEWKIINNFHVRVRRRNKVTGKYVSVVAAACIGKKLMR